MNRLRIIKPLILASVVLVAVGVSVPATAADMSVYKAPPPVLTYSWAGVYVGANLGYSVARDRASELLSDPAAGPVSTQSFSLAPTGAVAGGQVGYNMHASPHWVLGVEADWQWTNQTDSVCITGCNPNFLALTAEQQVQWLATLRGRFSGS
jgi:outer membrane immunogenic protein